MYLFEEFRIEASSLSVAGACVFLSIKIKLKCLPFQWAGVYKIQNGQIEEKYSILTLSHLKYG